MDVLQTEGEDIFYHLQDSESNVLEIGVLLKKSLLCHEVGSLMADCNGVSFKEKEGQQRFFITVSIDSDQEIQKAKQRLIETIKDIQSL